MLSGSALCLCKHKREGILRRQSRAALVSRLLLALAAVLLMVAALLRTWSSAYLRAAILYAAELKTSSLIADGPYRQVRNPLYLANVLMVIAMGAMMSRLGFFVVVVAMLVFCYRRSCGKRPNFRQIKAQSTRPTEKRCHVFGQLHGRALRPPDATPSGLTDSRQNPGIGASQRHLQPLP